jgi:hypothetical protein
MTTLLTTKYWWIKGLALLALALFVMAIGMPRLVAPVNAQASNELTEFRRFERLDGGGYVAVGAGLRESTLGNMTITLPSGAMVREAYLYLAMQHNDPNPPTTTWGALNWMGFEAVNIGNNVDTCVYKQSSSHFRADVTDIVRSTIQPGNPTPYTVDWDPGPTDAWPYVLRQGASLVVVYNSPNEPERDVFIYDGNAVVDGNNKTMTTTMTFPMATEPSGETTTVIGDGESKAPQSSQAIQGSEGAIGFVVSPFDGSDGPVWDTDTTDISSAIYDPETKNGSTWLRVDIEMYGDCLDWAAQVLSLTR